MASKGTVYRFDTEDDDGPTEVDFVLLPGGKNRVIFLTLVGLGGRAQRSTRMKSTRP